MLKTKSPADAAANGQTSPADDQAKPRYASVSYPVVPQGRRTVNECNAKPIAPRLMVPSLPSREGEETHIESITKECYHNILCLSILLLRILCL